MSRLACLLAFWVAACAKQPEKPIQQSSPDQSVPDQAVRVAPRREVPTQLTKVTIKALGMYCEESCPLRVRTALSNMPQIYQLGFDLTKESIFVSFDTSLGTAKEVTTPMLAAIKAAGFDPWLAKEAWPPEADAAIAVVP